MLLFIFPCCHQNDDWQANFNTSHVTVYLYISKEWRALRPDFNTSHVTVYLNVPIKFSFESIISIHPMLLFISSSISNLLENPYFNTSHVTVYRNTEGFAGKMETFQYIPCYCLSWIVLYRWQLSYSISIHPMLLFISLGRRLGQKEKTISIHPMLLFIHLE